MRICYIDEAGGVEAYGSRDSSTPLQVITGVIVDHTHVSQITHDFLQLKRTSYPGRFRRLTFLGSMLEEVKGADVRNHIRRGSRERRQALIFLGKTLDILESHEVRVIGRVWIKEPGKAMDPTGSYTYAIQDIGRHFHHHLDACSDLGLLLCDGREHNQDSEVSHSLFTQKHRTAGDSYPRFVETATFGRSVNHVGLQLADLVAAGILYPMAAYTYCHDYVANELKNGEEFKRVREQLGTRIKDLRYVYKDSAGKSRGGVVVSDPIGKRPSGLLFPS